MSPQPVDAALRCIRCKRLRLTNQCARSLCRSCYAWTLRHGVSQDFERQTRSADETLDDWAMLRNQGHTMQQAAERMGMTFDALDQAITRAKRRGDPRAVRQPA